MSPVTALFVTQVLAGDVTSVATVSTLTSLAAIPASAFWGRLSDRLGRRRPFIVFGILGFGVPILVQATSSSLLLVYVLGFSIGFFSLAIGPAASALIVETTPRDRWSDAFAYYSRAGSLGAVLGLAFGSAWLWQMPGSVGTEAALRSLMGLAGLSAVVGAVLAFVWVPIGERQEPPQPTAAPEVLSQPERPPETAASSRAYLSSIRQLCQQPIGRYFTAFFLLRVCTTLALTPIAVFLRQSLGAPEWVVMAAYLAENAIPAMAYQSMSRLGRKIGAVRLMGICTASRASLFVVGGVIALYPGTQHAMWAGVVVFSLVGLTWAGLAVAGPTALMQMTGTGRQGSTMGTYNAVSSAGNILGAFASGQVALHMGYHWGFFLAALTGLSGALLFLMVRSPQTDQPAQTASATD